MKVPFPPGCPVCGADIIERGEESAEFNAYVRFACWGEIVRLESGLLDANEHCRDALRNDVRKMNNLAKRTAAENAKAGAANPN
jgi:hypothetical protein